MTLQWEHADTMSLCLTKTFNIFDFKTDWLTKAGKFWLTTIKVVNAPKILPKKQLFVGCKICNLL